jgi:hypothetical protein
MVFSSLLNSTNAFYSRKFAHLDDDTLALVPTKAQIGDVVAQSIRDSQLGLPIVLRPVQEEIDPLLDAEISQKAKTLMLEVSDSFRVTLPKEMDHFRYVGECFVEGKMIRLTKGLSDSELRSLKFLALR